MTILKKPLGMLFWTKQNTYASFKNVRDYLRFLNFQRLFYLTAFGKGYMDIPKLSNAKLRFCFRQLHIAFRITNSIAANVNQSAFYFKVIGAVFVRRHAMQ